jgi:hypothetical protein
MKYISKPQLSKLHVLLSNLGIMDQKKEIIYSISNGRTESSKMLSFEEGRLLLMNLSQFDPRERIKASIFHLAYEAGIIYGSTEVDKKLNAIKLNMFIQERGAVKKQLNDMNHQELIKVKRQFEAIVSNSRKSKDKKIADEAVKNLLNDLNITIH